MAVRLMLKNSIRYAAYPTVLGLSALGVLMCISKSMSPWPNFAIIAALALLVVACLERIQPYQAAWLENHQDLIPDIGHAIGS